MMRSNFCEEVPGSGAAIFAHAHQLGLEGIVSKRVTAPYRSGRTETWVKTKCFEEAVYEVAAVLREPGRPAVAYLVTPDKERRYVGGAFITLKREIRERLWGARAGQSEAGEGLRGQAGDRVAVARPDRARPLSEGRSETAARDVTGSWGALTLGYLRF